MQVNLHNSAGNQFSNYTADSVTINQVTYSGNLLVTPSVIEALNLATIDDFNCATLERFLSYRPDIILFGTGTQIKYPEPQVLAKLQQLQIGFEVMPIPALCRTFNYLIGEDRRVIGLLIFATTNQG